MYSHVTRRRLLAAGVVALSGCTTELPFQSKPDKADIMLNNQTEQDIEYELELSLVDSAPEDILTDSGTLGADYDDADRPSNNLKIYANPITQPGTYLLNVQTSTGNEARFRWDDVEEPEKRTADTDGLEVVFHSDHIILTWESVEI